MAKIDIKVGFALGQSGLSGRARNALGQYTSEPYKQLRMEMEDLADRVHAEVVDNLRHQAWLRPEVSTGRLLKVTASKQNRWVAADGTSWGVGKESYLDGSIAKYWRTIEEGSEEVWSHPFIGTVLRGMWAGRTGPLVHHGKGAGQKFIPIASAPEGVVDKEIMGIHYYADAWSEVDVPTRTREAALKLLRGAARAALTPLTRAE